MVVPLFHQARHDAATIDAARLHGKRLGSLAGVPFTVKESFDVAGTATTMGLSTHRQRRATSDAYHVTRLREAGAILLGKTNTSQLLMGNESDNPVYGRTNNPWNPDRAPGGSSGGEAALIATGGSALGLGSDIGGSVRLPAHACGIQSIKPTSQRLTMVGHAPLYPGQEAIPAQPGPLARTVADLEMAIRFLSSPQQTMADVTIPPVPPLGVEGVPIKNMRIAVYTDNGIISAAPALRRAVREAAAALASCGAEVEEWSPPEAHLKPGSRTWEY
jgi:fatty acid amide hydrolase